jgi:signal transduction histidine kinase
MEILDETRQLIEYSRELEQKSKELKSLNARLKELDKLKDDFISTITHELRTPLTAVRSITEILHDNAGLDANQQKQFTGIVIKEVERLTRLISQVLDFQKLASGRMNWDITPLDLRKVITEAISASKQLIAEKKIRLAMRLPEKCPRISGDRDRLMQVLLNLISNAVKFCPVTGGAIEVELIVQADYLQVNVEDNGIGISAENQALIFEKFRQVKDNTKGRPKGSGLGLSITRQIIEVHNGRIWVESELGKGAKFSFSLPKMQSARNAS